MPNWCHNTLTVEGEPDAIAAFAAKVAKTEADDDGGPQPLTFRAHAPEPSAEVYAAMEEAAKIDCDLCGGFGKRPTTRAEAKAMGARFEVGWENMPFLQEIGQLAVAERPDCNQCRGTGRYNPNDAWYDWRLEHWGCKWDASFDGPFLALGTADADVAASVAANGRVAALNLAIYKFDTPWGPPEAWLRTVIAAEPALRFTLRFAEMGNDFAGEIVGQGGKVTESHELDVDDVLEPEQRWY